MKHTIWRNLFITHVVCLAFFVLFLGPSLASVFYIVPKAEVPIRSGQGRQYKIVAVLHEGTEVTLIEEDGPWSRVRLADGKEGWILSRYLSPEPPPKMQLEEAKNRLRELESTIQASKKRLEDTQVALNACEKERETCLSQKDDITNKYNLLLEDSKNIVTLKQKYEKQVMEINNLKKEVAVLKSENSDLKNDQNIRWFMAGSGVLLLGWLIGYSLGRRNRRRTSSLL